MSAHEMVLTNGLPSRNGTLRLCASVWLYKKTAAGISVLVQKRAEGIHNGGFYDVSAGGHADGTETPLAAAIREAREEIGVSLSPDNLEFLCAYRITDKIVHTFLADWTNRPDSFSLDPEEVELVEWIPLSDLDDFWQTSIKPTLRENNFHLTLLRQTLENL